MIIKPSTSSTPTPPALRAAAAAPKPAEEGAKGTAPVKKPATDHTDISPPESEHPKSAASSIADGVHEIVVHGASDSEKGLGSLKSVSGGLIVAGQSAGSAELSAAGHKIRAGVEEAHSRGPLSWIKKTASSVGHGVASGIGDGVKDAEKLGDKVSNTAREAAYKVEQNAIGEKNKLLGPPKDAPLSSGSRQILQRDHLKSASKVTDPGQRSKIAYNALKANMGGTTNLEELKGSTGASAWTYGQTMVAALDQAKQTGKYGDFNSLVKSLGKYKTASGGYAPNTNGVSGTGNCFYDDNSWIGLAFMQAHNQLSKSDPKQAAQYLNDAKSTFNFVKTGQTPEGGLVWGQNQQVPTYNTCAEGPATELAMQLHMATAKNPKDTNDEYFKFAGQVYGNMQQNLLIKSGPNAGLYADHVPVKAPSQQIGVGLDQDLLDSASGATKGEDKIHSYNQGTPVGAATLLYKATGDPKYLDQAQQTANASVKYYSQGDHLMKQAPAFNAVYMRNLLQLDAVAPNPKYKELLTNYNNQLWQDKLNPQSGLFDKPSDVPMGRYGGTATDVSTLDQAALVQLSSLQAMDPSSYSELT